MDLPTAETTCPSSVSNQQPPPPPPITPFPLDSFFFFLIGVLAFPVTAVHLRHDKQQKCAAGHSFPPLHTHREIEKTAFSIRRLPPRRTHAPSPSHLIRRCLSAPPPSQLDRRHSLVSIRRPLPPPGKWNFCKFMFGRSANPLLSSSFQPCRHLNCTHSLSIRTNTGNIYENPLSNGLQQAFNEVRKLLSFPLLPYRAIILLLPSD